MTVRIDAGAFRCRMQYVLLTGVSVWIPASSGSMGLLQIRHDPFHSQSYNRITRTGVAHGGVP